MFSKVRQNMCLAEVLLQILGSPYNHFQSQLKHFFIQTVSPLIIRLIKPLWRSIKSEHSFETYDCKCCDLLKTTLHRLKQHEAKIHDGVNYNSTDQSNLRIHASWNT